MYIVLVLGRNLQNKPNGMNVVCCVVKPKLVGWPGEPIKRERAWNIHNN